MNNYAQPLPVDQKGTPMQEYPANKPAYEEWASENAVASSVITLTDSTTTIEISTNGGPAAIKWIASTDTTASVVTAAATADFDHVVPQNTYRRFVVPIERYGITSLVGANKQNGLYNRVAFKAFGISSVLMTEH